MSKYVSGTWMVRDGVHEEFVSRWTEFTQWSLENADGAEDFMLMHEIQDPRHYVSIGVFRDTESINGWRNSAEFARLRGRVVELCDQFRGTDFDLVARPVRTTA